MSENVDAVLHGRKFKKLIEHIYGEFREKYGLRQVEIEILLYLNDHPDMSSTEVHRNLCLNKGHVSQAMDNLCKKGFLLSERDVDDRRYVSYSITSYGEEFIKQADALRESTLQQLFAGISAEEREMMRQISAKICYNIDRIKLD